MLLAVGLSWYLDQDCCAVAIKNVRAGMSLDASLASNICPETPKNSVDRVLNLILLVQDEVLIAGFGRRGHAVGDIPGVRFKVSMLACGRTSLVQYKLVQQHSQRADRAVLRPRLSG